MVNTVTVYIISMRQQRALDERNPTLCSLRQTYTLAKQINC
jgi:hypothetical protein